MVIMGNAALLRSSLKGISPRTAENIQLIEEASSRASLLIKHLLAYARTGRHNPQPTDINTIVQASVAFVQSSLGKNYELDVQLAKPLETVLADRGQVEQVLLNLCLNAKQAMLKGGRITIATRKVSLTAAQVARCVPFDIPPGDYVELLVADTGCGMDDSTRAKIFDPFFTTKPEGHGLGLAAVLGILRQHHGAARVESQLGKGTKMHVYFPVGG
jgi:signal transduction histidine kinase